MNKISALLLFFALTMATAERGPRVPRETGSAAAPARAPGPVSVLVPTTTAANTWVNAHTCGWVAGVSCKFLVQTDRVRRFFYYSFAPCAQQTMT